LKGKFAVVCRNFVGNLFAVVTICLKRAVGLLTVCEFLVHKFKGQRHQTLETLRKWRISRIRLLTACGSSDDCTPAAHRVDDRM